MSTRWHILVVDDEEVARESLAAWLREDGHAVATAACGQEAIARSREEDFAICFLDLKMPGGLDGLETMAEIRKLRPEATIIIFTAYATVDTAVAAMKEGAHEYLVKPCNPEEISILVARILKVKELQRENQLLRKRLARQYVFQDILSKNPRMLEIFHLIRAVADPKSTVLIQGESGTGKELIARAIHHSGLRAPRPFVGVSCAALVETLLESELFGHEEGAFTGARSRKKGKFELAGNGTIFLDEIGDIPPKLQMDLLRVLQARRFYRVGGTVELPMEARVIAATNRDLGQAVREGRFREDLFYRLNVISIQVPPLRDRREDIPLLAQHFVDRLSRELRKEVTGLSAGAHRVLLAHGWPGNVRELENALERAIVTAKGPILTEADFAFLEAAQPREAWEVPTDLTLEEVQNRVIAATLRRTGGNLKEAAAILGVDRSTLYDRLKRHGIPRG